MNVKHWREKGRDKGGTKGNGRTSEVERREKSLGWDTIGRKSKESGYIYIYISMVRQERDERYASAVSATSIDSERPPYL